ncbi:MAG: hypothetical protein EBZ59_00715 [Planctomycetia bacterium]|nr:hypothetical protein [Planctomycetia bacterium]
MPLHDVGYRPWHGTLLGPGSAVAVIAITGIRLAWTSRWLRRAVFFAWSPALIFAASFFAFEQAIQEGRLETMREAARAGRNLDGVGMLATVLADTMGGRRHGGDPVRVEETRRTVWSRLLLAFMRVPQAVLLAVVIGLIAPTLVSRDLRAKAWLFYFTRPVGRTEYILGKAATIAVLVVAITMLPALTLWVMGVLVSPSIRVAAATCDLPLRVVCSSLVLAVPTVLLALAYSSLTAESRIASFAWFATWIACWIAHSALLTADGLGDSPPRAAAADGRGAPAAGWLSGVLPQTRGAEAAGRGRGGMSAPRGFRWLARAAGVDGAIDRWSWISPYHALGVVQAWIFGIETRGRVVAPAVASLLVISLASVLVLALRVDAPLRS